MLATLLLVVSLDPAFPVFDIEATCRDEPGALEPSYVAACVRNERASSKALKVEWVSLTAEQKRFCLEAAEKAEVGKYTTMVSYAAIFNKLNQQRKGDTALRP